MKVFAFHDYRDYLRAYFKSLPQAGYGKLAELAGFCEMNPATLSLVIKKDRDFTLDQASDVCSYLGLSDLETEYFFISVQLMRAGRPSLRARLEKKLAELQAKAENIKDRLGEVKDFDENAKATFYSDWFYSAVRLSTSIPDLDNVDSLSKRLGLPRQNVQKVVEFLLTHGLIAEENKKLKIAMKHTHLGSDSMLTNRHHSNWRLKALERMPSTKKDELFFTSPAILATADIPRVREKIIQAIEGIMKVIEPSKEEELTCLNIDWFRV